jgi:beta-xylosidase
MKKNFLILFAFLPMAAMAQYHSQVWSPDNGDGTYTNPVINADYSDPDVCVGASGTDFYLTASSFNCIPGLPILHSKDLVNWEIVGHAIKKLTPDSVFNKAQHGNGVWAPSIRYHNGEYYIYWGDPDYGVFMVKTQDPAGDWSEPLCVIPRKGMIDTTPLWDEDGRCYLVNGWAGSRAGFNSVLSVRELSADGTKAISDPVIVFDGGNANHTTEGPKFYKRNGWYWIMCPAGGVPVGWQLAMRSKSPFGPYECKTVMATGKSKINGPHQGGWIHTAQGEDWFLHFQDKGVYGRVVLLQPVHWVDNWPVMGVDKDGDLCGDPVSRYKKPNVGKTYPVMNPVESDEFNTTVLGKQWQWHANYQQNFGQPTPYGFFRLFTHKLSESFVNLWEAPNLLLQKTPADRFTATAKIKFASKADNQYGGIIMMGMDYSALVVKRVGDVFQLQQITCKNADKNKPESVNILATLHPTEKDKIPYQPAIYEEIYLRMIVNDGKVNFSYSSDGKSYKAVGDEFTMREGKWIGAKIGFVAEENNLKGNSGYIDADWFRITK